MGTGAADSSGLGSTQLEQGRREYRKVQARAVRAAHAADGVYALRVRRRWRAGRSVEPRSVSLFDRLSAHGRRTESARAFREVAWRSFRCDPRPVLCGELFADIPGRTRVT